MATTAQKLSSAEIAEAVGREGGLLGVTAAARVLGIWAANFKRDAAPHLTEIESDPHVYLRSEVEQLARQFAKEGRGAPRNGKAK